MYGNSSSYPNSLNGLMMGLFPSKAAQAALVSILQFVRLIVGIMLFCFAY